MAKPLLCVKTVRLLALLFVLTSCLHAEGQPREGDPVRYGPGGVEKADVGTLVCTECVDTDDITDGAVTNDKIATLGDSSDSANPVSFATLVNVRATQTVTASTQQLNCGTREGMNILPISANADYTLSSNPQIIAGRVGQVCRMIGTHASNFVTIVDGNGIANHRDGNVTLSLGYTRDYYYDGTNWIETFDGAPFACQWEWNIGAPRLNCGSTDVVLQPGQSGGNLLLNDFGGTLCLTIDPDNGNVTQGANCQTLTASHNIAVAAEAYDATGWNGDTTVPQKDAIRDQLETVVKTRDIDWYTFYCVSEADGTAYMRPWPNTCGAETWGNSVFQTVSRGGTVRRIACVREVATGSGNTRAYTVRLDGTSDTNAACSMANASTCSSTSGSTAVTALQVLSVRVDETAGTPAESRVNCRVGIEVTP